MKNVTNWRDSMFYIVYTANDNLYYETIKDLYELPLIDKCSDNIVKIYTTHDGMNNKTYKTLYSSLTDETLMVLTNEYAIFGERPKSKVVRLEHPWDRKMSALEVMRSKAITRAIDVDIYGKTLDKFIIDNFDMISESIEQYQNSLEKELLILNDKVTNDKKQLIEKTGVVYNKTNQLTLTDDYKINEMFDKIKDSCDLIDRLEQSISTLTDGIMNIMEFKFKMVDIKTANSNKIKLSENDKMFYSIQQKQ